MTGNMSYLTNFKEFDGGYVAFGGGSKGGKITGKGTIKTKLNFKDMYIVKELKFNLFSVLQMCDKKNNVLFPDIECFVLSPNFKLADESQVLLKVPRKNNMYNVDMKNIVLKESLTYLVAKATLDESMLWHRMLGHVNFKTINKLVKENLVKGLPSKSFENDQTCVACLKEKQHKASYHLGKFEGKADEGFFVGYSMNNTTFRVYNIRTRKVEENLYIEFLENKPIIAGDGPKWLFDIDVLTESMNYVLVVTGTNSNDFAGTKDSIDAGQSSMETGSSQECILMPLWKDGSLFDSSLKNSNDDGSQPSSDAKKKVNEGPINTVRSSGYQTGPDIPTLGDIATLEATHNDFFSDESDMRNLNEIEVDMSNITNTYLVLSTPNTRIHKDHSLGNVISDVQSGEEPKRITKALSDPAWVEGKRPIGTKWVFRNKKDERGIVIKNKARLVAQRFNKEEGIDYDEVFAPVARIKAIRLFLAYASFMEFLVYEIDVKSAFLYGRIEKEVYVDDIIFGSTKKELCTEFKKLMHDKVQMSSIGELTFFLGLQVKQKEDGIFISQDKYVAEILRKFNSTDVKTASTPMDIENDLLKDSYGDDVDVHLYRSMIRYAFTENPTIYVSHIEQFWHTATAKTLDNGEQELTATVDGKVKTITESSVRRHLKLADGDDKAISFGEDDRMERAVTIVSRIEAGQDSGTINKTQSMITPAGPSSLRDSSEGGPGDSPLPRVNTLGSDKGSMQQNKLIKLCTKLSEKVTSLEYDLKQKKLVYGVALTKLINKDASKQERKIDMDAGDVSTAGADINAASVPVSIISVGVSTASPTVSTANPTINTASPTRTTDVSASETLVYIRRSATKDKELAQKLHEEEQARFNAKQEARFNAKQEAKFNAEQEELLSRETTEDEANPSVADIDWDDVKAQIQADEDLAQRMLEEEREIMGKERTKRAGLNLQEESLKRQKTGEVSRSAAEQQELDDLVKLWSLVQEKFNSIEPTYDKERELWVELKRVDIYMLGEREYPLSRGTLTLMLVAKLLVDEDSEIARELLRKIVMQADRPRR
ncbi:putative ribonuclease H-like domain-containing protein [Tanacetum coccineum]